MDGIVNKIQFDSSGWIVEVINPLSNLVSLYKSVDSLNISIGDTILMYERIGVIPKSNSFLHYELYNTLNGYRHYINPLKEFNKCFE